MSTRTYIRINIYMYIHLCVLHDIQGMGSPFPVCHTNGDVRVDIPHSLYDTPIPYFYIHVCMYVKTFFINVHISVCVYMYVYIYPCPCFKYMFAYLFIYVHLDSGQHRSIYHIYPRECEYRLFYRALLQKRPMI